MFIIDKAMKENPTSALSDISSIFDLTGAL